MCAMKNVKELVLQKIYQMYDIIIIYILFTKNLPVYFHLLYSVSYVYQNILSFKMQQYLNVSWINIAIIIS